MILFSPLEDIEFIPSHRRVILIVLQLHKLNVENSKLYIHRLINDALGLVVARGVSIEKSYPPNIEFFNFQVLEYLRYIHIFAKPQRLTIVTE